MAKGMRPRALAAVRAGLAEGEQLAAAGDYEGAIFALARAAGRVAIEHGISEGAPVCRRYEAELRRARVSLSLLPQKGRSVIRDDRAERARKAVREVVS